MAIDLVPEMRSPTVGQSTRPDTFRLCKTTPSFVEGVARLFDFRGLLDDYHYDATEELADYHALVSDWRCVGTDLRNALAQYERQVNS